jgi:hypothetical protein
MSSRDQITAQDSERTAEFAAPMAAPDRVHGADADPVEDDLDEDEEDEDEDDEDEEEEEEEESEP